MIFVRFKRIRQTRKILQTKWSLINNCKSIAIQGKNQTKAKQIKNMFVFDESKPQPTTQPNGPTGGITQTGGGPKKPSKPSK